MGDAALVISELLSNSIQHAWPLPGEQLQVAWLVDQGCVEVAVRDGGGPTQPAAGTTRPARRWAAAGSASSTGCPQEWGIRRDDTGQTVWAVLPAPRSCAAVASSAC